MDYIPPGGAYGRVTVQEQIPVGTTSSWAVRWIMKVSGGFIKTERSARILLVVLSLALIVVAILLTIGATSGHSATVVAPPGAQLLYPADASPRLAQPYGK